MKFLHPYLHIRTIGLGKGAFRDSILRLLIYNNQRRRRLNTVWNGVWSAQLKHGNIKDWVYSMHSSQKTECPG
jgi:hypothetical protein